MRAQSRSAPAVHACKNFWLQAITALLTLQSVDTSALLEAKSFIEDGISMPFNAAPLQHHYKNSTSLSSVMPQCITQIEAYNRLGVISKVDGIPALIHPLLAVVKEGKKPRLCLDLSRNFNEFLPKKHFKLLATQAAVDLSEPNCFYGKLDLSSCFLSFPLAPSLAKLMAFSFKGEYFQFDNMPFGLSPAPRIASSLLDIVSARLHEQGVRHTRYIDDYLFIGATPQAIIDSLLIASQLFLDFGLMLNPDKIEGPVQQIGFLGLWLDSVACTLSLPEAKKQDAKILFTSILQQRKASLKTLRSLLGKLSFMSSVLPASRPFMRQVIDATSGPLFSGRARRLSASFKAELQFWCQNLDSWDGTRRWSASSTPIVFASDASTEGFAFVVESAPIPASIPSPQAITPGFSVSGVWSGPDVAQFSHRAIGYGELFAPVAASLLAGPALANSHVVFVLDNQSDVDIINRRDTKSPRLLSLLKLLCSASMSHNFAFTAIHRQGVANILPDYLSRPSLHKFSLSPVNINLGVIGEINSTSSSSSLSSSAVLTAPISLDNNSATSSHGSFFLSDHISRLHTRLPRLSVDSCVFFSSASIRSKLKTSAPWAIAFDL